MGRKNKLKSTFIDKVIPGTLWKCHNKDRIMLNQTLTWIEKGDFCIVLSIETGFFKDIKMVKCLSQKKLVCYLTTLEDFYFNYHEV
jgi:hypothetical protein